MFNVPQPKVNEFSKLYDTHRVMVSGCDVFFQNIRMLNGRHTIMDRQAFVDNYKVFTSDIELQSSPIDSFIPNASEEGKKLFLVNRDVPEYERIKNRVTMEELKKTFNETHPIIMALADQSVTYDDVIDDVFIYWCVFKYIEQIEKIRIQMFSNFTPVIEYIVQNIDYHDLRRYLISQKIRPEKIDKHSDTVFFGPDYDMICKFYQNEKNAEEEIPIFDLDHLMQLLMSNITLTSDIYIIVGMYLTASFAVADFKGHTKDSPCCEYVRNVLAVV